MVHRVRPLLVLLPLLVLTPAFVPGLSAQETRVAEGERVRLHRAAQPAVEGTLTAVAQDAWTVALPSGGTVDVEPRDVVRAERWETRSRWLRGALIGGGVGLALGVVTLASDDDDTLASYSLQPAILGTSILAGAAAGALIGALVRTGRWTPALLPAEVGSGSFGLEWTLPTPF